MHKRPGAIGRLGRFNTIIVPGDGGGPGPDPDPVSEINTVTIWGSTLLDATGDWGSGTTREGIDVDGYVAQITMPYRVAATFDPTKIIHEITDPGYDGSGTTTVVRQVRGTVVLRRQYTAQASFQQSNDGVTVTIFYALEAVVYQGSTLTKVTAEAGYYGDLEPGTVTNKTNNSARPYYKPLCAWINTQHERATGTYNVELAVAHIYGRNGRMAGRVEFTTTDGNGHTAAKQTSADTALSSIQTQGNITEAFKASIPVTALDQGALCTVDADVFPWIGDSSSVLRLSTDGFAWPTANPQTPLRFWLDKSATRGAYAFVRAGASGGTVSKTLATARAAPFPTLSAAFTALATFNGGDHSGSTIYLMDDGASGAVAHTIAAGISTTAGNCWTDIRVDPSAVGAVSLDMTATRSIPDKVRWFVDITHTAGNGFDSGSTPNSKMLAFGGGTITSTSTGSLHYRIGLNWLTNVTINATSNRAMMAGYATTRTQTVLALGVIAEGATGAGTVLPYAMIGCRLRRFALQEINPASLTSNDDQDGMFVMNNWFRQLQSSGTLVALLSQRETARGMAIIQNLFEGAANQTCVRLGGDGTNVECDNVLFYHNTMVGGRFNNCYTDVAAAVGVRRRVKLRYNICNDTWNCKTDTFTTQTTTTGRTGNWENHNMVDNWGNVASNGSANFADPDPNGGSWLGSRWDNDAWEVGSMAFTDDKSLPIGTGALGGTYSLVGSSHPAYDRVMAGEAVLKYDIAGVARRNDGTGAAGCYERTVG